jgi:hypothetical protein
MPCSFHREPAQFLLLEDDLNRAEEKSNSSGGILGVKKEGL